MNKSRKIGYARVASSNQNLVHDMELQIDALTKAGCEHIYSEIGSGKSANRVELGNCLKALRTGDTLVVWRLNRLGRNMADIAQILGDLKSRGVTFASLTEAIDTSGKL